MSSDIEPLPSSLSEFNDIWNALIDLIPADYNLFNFWGSDLDSSSLDLVAGLLAIDNFYHYTLADDDTQKELISNFANIYQNISTPEMVLNLLSLYGFPNATLLENTSPWFYDVALYDNTATTQTIANIRKVLENNTLLRIRLGSISNLPPQYIDGSFYFNGSRYFDGTTTEVT